MNYGIQMYSLRDITGQDLEGALKAVAEMGYKTVEFAGFFGHSAEDVRDMLTRYNLICSGTHSGLGDLIDNFEETVKYHKTIGNKNIIVPGADLGNQEKIDAFVEMVNKFQPMLAAEGIDFHYHNHSHEFLPNADGTMIHEQLEARTNILFQIDTYWAFAAKLDPVATITRLKDRIRLIHLKDGDGGHKGFSLGMGAAPVAAVRNCAIDLGFKMVVESEGLDPTGIEEVQRCITYLKSLDAADGK
jgi:sugar phosphate isomerase/epimerase